MNVSRAGFLKALFAGQSGLIAVALAIADTIIVFVPVLDWIPIVRILTALLLSAIVLATTFLVRAYSFFEAYQNVEKVPLLKLRLLRQTTGQGPYAPAAVYTLENPGSLRDNLLLTVFSTTTGVAMPVGILQIIRAQSGAEMLAVSYPEPENPVFQVNDFLNAENNTYSLFASPLVHAVELQSLTQVE